MTEPINKKRCACYCRKSCEDGLEQEFNSLDAQREACEMYIASQKINGWVCLPEHYDDGGFSGGNIERPALKKLLEDCKNGLVDIIVIYKLDRLSRSICDFADLSKKFEQWNVNFVSVTQEINTANSAGRMMLNILITFAQYERELIVERVRDKLRASRRRGMWTGGMIPLGYNLVNKKLLVNPQEAEIIKRIFQRYIETQSVKLIVRELNAEQITMRKNHNWKQDTIYRILKNHIYCGELKYQNVVFKGEHEAIISTEIWQRVQEILEHNVPFIDYSKTHSIIAPLRGILRCGHCNSSMMPICRNIQNRKYFYYRCVACANSAEPNCPIRNIKAPNIEKLVFDELKRLLNDSGIVELLAQKSGMEPCYILTLFKQDFWNEISFDELNRLFQLLIEQVVAWEDKVEIEFKTNGIKSLIVTLKMSNIETLGNGNVKITIPVRLCSVSRLKRVIPVSCMESSTDEPIVRNIVRAFAWQDLVDSGKFRSAEALAKAIGREYSTVVKIMRLTTLCPEIIHAALTYQLPAHATFQKLNVAMRNPDWEEQKKIIGLK